MVVEILGSFQVAKWDDGFYALRLYFKYQKTTSIYSRKKFTQLIVEIFGEI